MARTTKKNTQVAADNNNTQVAISNLASIKDVIAYAHDELHNKKALTLKDFNNKGLSENDFNQWCDYVEILRDAVKELRKVTTDREASDKDVDTALGGFYSAWRAVLKEGTEKDFNKNFFIRKMDVVEVGGWGGYHVVDSAVGKLPTIKGKADFRKNIETIIGMRMAGNAVLDDEKRDLIVNYEKALKTIKNKTDALEDSKDKKGNTIAGLKTLVIVAETNYKNEEEFFNKYNVDEAVKSAKLTPLKKKIDDAKAAVKEAQDKLKEAEDFRDENKADYDMTIALLHSVGDFK